MEKKIFTVPQKGVGKQRPRFNSRTRRTYTPKKTKEFEELVKAYYLSKFGIEPDYDKAIRLKITFIEEPAKSYSEKKKKKMMNTPILKTPDLDNRAKAIMDGLNGVAYKDDKQIYDLHVIKMYGGSNNIIIELEYEEW